MSNLEDTKAQIPSVFWTIANGVFLTSGIALIVMRNDYLWGGASNYRWIIWSCNHVSH